MTDSPTTTPLEAWQQWRAERDAEFAEPLGWLSVTALEWLGASPAAVSDLPGEWSVDKQGFHVELEASTLTVDGQAVSGSALLWDLTGEAPTVFDGARQVELLTRDNGLRGLRVRDPQEVVRRGFSAVPAFAYDPAWRVVGQYRAYDDAQQVAVDTVLPGLRHQQSVTGEITFDIDGQAHTLKVSDGSWISYRDATNGVLTTHNCRWVDVDASTSGEVVVDFNFSANPPCAFTDFATCPLPPAGNALTVGVLAGEKDPRR